MHKKPKNVQIKAKKTKKKIRFFLRYFGNENSYYKSAGGQGCLKIITFHLKSESILWKINNCDHCRDVGSSADFALVL